MCFSLPSTPMCQVLWPPAMGAMGLPPSEVPGNTPSEVPDKDPAEVPPAPRRNIPQGSRLKPNLSPRPNFPRTSPCQSFGPRDTAQAALSQSSLRPSPHGLRRLARSRGSDA